GGHGSPRSGPVAATGPWSVACLGSCLGWTAGGPVTAGSPTVVVPAAGDRKRRAIATPMDGPLQHPHSRRPTVLVTVSDPEDAVELLLSTRPGRDCTVIEVSGELDMATEPQLRDALEQAIDAGSRQVVVDLGRVRFMDSTAVGMLIATF